MVRIESFEQYREIVREGKQLPNVCSNCYFLPAAVRDMIDCGKLYTQQVCGGVLLLEKERTFFRCYYYLSLDSKPETVRLPMPAVVEFVFRSALSEAQRVQVRRLEQMGFVLGRESARMYLDAANAAVGAADAAELARESDADRVLALIEENFDPLYAYIGSKEALLKSIRNGWVFVIRRETEPVAVLHAEVSKGTASIRHLTVSKACRSQGFGRQLVLRYHEAFRAEVRGFSHWLDKNNAAAIRLYTGLGYCFDERYANEYVIK